MENWFCPFSVLSHGYIYSRYIKKYFQCVDIHIYELFKAPLVDSDRLFWQISEPHSRSSLKKTQTSPRYHPFLQDSYHTIHGSIYENLFVQFDQDSWKQREISYSKMGMNTTKAISINWDFLRKIKYHLLKKQKHKWDTNTPLLRLSSRSMAP